MDAGTIAGVAMDVNAYLRRIGFDGSRHPSAATLRELHSRHLSTVPFENLDIALGTIIRLEPEALFEKIVVRRRGGFCYELNSVFCDLLRVLGFRVDMLSARVSRRSGGFGPEFDHMLLKVSLEEPWIADVGFGDSFIYPLSLEGPASRETVGKTRYWINTLNREHELVRHGGDEAPTPQYRFTEVPRQLSDFAEMCVFHQTSTDSHFTQGSVCSMALPDGRVTLSGMRLITTRLGMRQEAILQNETELQSCLRQRFGIEFADKTDLSRLAA